MINLIKSILSVFGIESETIINIVKQLLERFTTRKPVQRFEDKITIEKADEVSHAIRISGKIYNFENDKLILKQDYPWHNVKVDKCIAGIHYTGYDADKTEKGKIIKASEVVAKYLANAEWKSASYIIGREGDNFRNHKYIENIPWTQGLLASTKGGFIDYQGKWRRSLNNIGVSFELVNVANKDFTEQQYKDTAIRLFWMLQYFSNYRIWLTAGHEHFTPMERNDPGSRFDWELLFCKYLGVRKDFYDEYLSYLAATSQMNATERKIEFVKESALKIAKDLTGKNKEFCF